MNQFAFIESIENDKFAICAKINYFSIAKLFERFVAFVARVYFDILNVLFVKYVFHRDPSCFCENFTKKYLIKFKFIKSKLAKVQIKGISSGEIISFKDRDRGGQGIDYTHECNRGKRITKADCNIYVAVDKQVGICYLIPMSFADTLSDDECSKVKLEQVQNFKENWDIIKEVVRAKNLKKSKG